MATGIHDLKLITLPAAWDDSELRRLQLRDGATVMSVLADLNAALGAFNGTLRGGWMTSLFSVTSEPTVEYLTGGGNGFQPETEYSQPDTTRGQTTGHMLPLKGYDNALGWTRLFLEEARRAQLDASVDVVMQDARDLWEKAVLTRLFKMEEETGQGYGLGSGGYSVPFADGGAGTVAYTPRPMPERGGTFAASHNHFLRLDGITQANLETAVAHIWEHGHDAPYDLIASYADLADWTNTTNVTGYKARGNDLINYGNSADLANVDAQYLGVIETDYGPVRVRVNGRIPTGYWAVVKSYGNEDARNPIKIRYDEARGLGLTLIVDNVALHPLTGAIIRTKFGAGVGMDRTAAVLVENDSSGTYATPTIS